MNAPKAPVQRYRALLLPGSVLPADLAYGALIAAIGERGEAIAKDLEVYAGPEPPADYTLEYEVGGVLRTARDAGFDYYLVKPADPSVIEKLILCRDQRPRPKPGE